MERAKYLFVVILFFFSCISFGQCKSAVYQSFIDGDMSRWKIEIDSLQKIPNMDNSNKLNLINDQIGYIGWCIGMKRYNEAKKYIELSESRLNELKDDNFKPSYVTSFEAAVDGLKIGIHNIYALILGPEIISQAKSSIKLNWKNPYGYILLGNSKYYMWSVMGGSKEEAIDYYKKAEKIIERYNKTDCNWNYLSLLTMIAHAYEQMGYVKDANLYYQKILRVEPNYTWIKEEVYPKFLTEYEGK